MIILSLFVVEDSVNVQIRIFKVIDAAHCEPHFRFDWLPESPLHECGRQHQFAATLVVGLDLQSTAVVTPPNLIVPGRLVTLAPHKLPLLNRSASFFQRSEIIRDLKIFELLRNFNKVDFVFFDKVPHIGILPLLISAHSCFGILYQPVKISRLNFVFFTGVLVH